MTPEEILEKHIADMVVRKDNYISVDTMKNTPEWAACIEAMKEYAEEMANTILNDVLCKRVNMLLYVRANSNDIAEFISSYL
jgi:hypothetical protein